jgi:tRNA threonylcarbamoyladenosine biosynthesis protein TsaB
MGRSAAMIILTIRTDKPESELGLYDKKQQLAYEKWEAHRTLSDTLHTKIEEILNKSSKSLKDIEGIAIYKGPGSFTGLRIGMSVANALAYAQNIPVIVNGGEDWLEQSIKDLLAGKNDKIALPEYGSPANTTQPRK